MRPRNVILVGPMGVGKTTVGRALARQTGMTFVDCDQELEKRTGVSIPTIFDIEGEEGFRRREREMLGEIADGRDLVIATGGGVVVDPENRRVLRGAGLVVYLTAPVGRLLRRIRDNRSRPLLQREDPAKVLTELMETREPLYREVADLTIKVNTRSPQCIARRIHERVEQHANP